MRQYIGPKLEWRRHRPIETKSEDIFSNCYSFLHEMCSPRVSRPKLLYGFRLKLVPTLGIRVYIKMCQANLDWFLLVQYNFQVHTDLK
jgi:hypothetical protein